MHSAWRQRRERNMQQRLKTGLAGGAAAVALALGLLGAVQFAPSADHLDPPSRTDPAVDSTPDRPADIADVYAWHTDKSLIIALTFAGPQATSLPATYD